MDNKLTINNHQRIIRVKPQLSVKTKDNRISGVLTQEIENLKLIYLDKIIGIPPEIGYVKAIQITITPEKVENEKDIYASLILCLHFPEEYPNHIPKIDFSETSGFQVQEQDELFQKLFDIALSLEGEQMIYEIVIECQKCITQLQENLAQRNENTQNLYQVFMQDERKRKNEQKKKAKIEEKENKVKMEDEIELRQQWLQNREKDVPEWGEDDIDVFKKDSYLNGWQSLSNSELLLLHLLKFYQKQRAFNNYKYLSSILKQFQISTKKEWIKLLSPKYEVVFNNLFTQRFDKLLKQEQEKLDLAQAEKINLKHHPDKALTDKSNFINSLFSFNNNNSSSNPTKQNESIAVSPSKQVFAIQKPLISAMNRMNTDFDIVQILGKGSFGEVFKVKNKIDGRFYAIKKIKVPQGAALNRILREVDLLSRLHHRNVIRYYQAWIDETEGQNEDFNISDEDSDLIVGSGFTVNNSLQYKFNSMYSNSIISSVNQSQFENAQISKKVLALFIQTEYCTKTLRQQIDEVYNTINDSQYIWNQFRQILDAIAYTHKQKIIHRDLKPENIFIDVTGDIKIGDFGLAKHTNKQTHNITYTTSVEDELQIPEILNYFTQDQNIQEQDFDILNKTLNVGTYFYCPPNDQGFDEKRDIYALGIILFEMWYPFINKKERVKALTYIKRRGKLPKNFAESHQRQAKLIKWMINQDASKRPNIQDILHSELIPPKLEDEYFKEAIKVLSVTSNENVYYQKLMGALFNNNKLFCVDRDRVIPSKTIYMRQNYLPQIMKYFQQQCVVQISTPIYIQKPKINTKASQQLVQSITKQGEVVFLRNTLRSSFLKYIENIDNQLIQNKQIKCYEIGETYHLENGNIATQFTLSYDSIFINNLSDDNLSYTLIMALHTLQVIGLTPIRIKLNYEPFLYELLETLKISEKEEKKKIYQYMASVVRLNQSLNAGKLKQFIQNDESAQFINLKYSDKIDKLIFIFQFKQKLYNLKIDDHFKVSEHCKTLNENLNRFCIDFITKLRIYNLSDSFKDIIYDASLNNRNYGFRNGYHFEIEIKESQKSIIYGGTNRKSVKKMQTICSLLIDAPQKIEINLNYFGSIQRSNSSSLSNFKQDLPLSKIQSQQLSQGVHLSQKCQEMIEMQGFTLDLDQIEDLFQISSKLFKYQVLICSNGQNMDEAKLGFQFICQINNIPSLIYNDQDYYSFEEQIQFAERNDIKVIVMIKDKFYIQKQKAHIRFKKDKTQRIEKEMSIDEFRIFLSKHNLK